MRPFLISGPAVAVVVALVPAPVAAVGPEVAQGGGRGTVDGATPFSQFGFQVARHADGSITGHFNCLMAGASAVPGLNVMAVQGLVREVSFATDGAVIHGSGALQTGNQGTFPATFRAVVTDGGRGEGTLQLTLLTPFFLEMPIEQVLNGRIDVR